MKKLLLAMGSDILMDEAISIILARDIKQSFPDFELQIHLAGGIELIRLFSGFDLVVIIDTIMISDAKPGEIRVFNGFHGAATLHLQNPHDVGFLDSLKLAQQLDYRLPEKIVILGISIKQQLVASHEPSPNITKNYNKLLEKARELLQQAIYPKHA